ncbi:ATP-binding protein, partial [Klebsiella pneumoniae]|nr:ATP-binding protein [Klebsiella pneumoniae]MBL2109654.1 ATP-binding protein [Klebsiella pneumoniae]
SARGDEVIYKSQVYTVTRWLLFNGKPQIWIEEVTGDD